MKTKQRLGFNFLRSYYDVLEDIHRNEDKLTYLMAILDKQFKGIEPELTGIPRLCYNGQKHSIDKSVEGWESKTKQTLYDPTEGGSEGIDKIFESWLDNRKGNKFNPKQPKTT